MSVVPTTQRVIIYPLNKTVAPYAADIVGYSWISGLHPDVSPPETPPELPPIEEPPPETTLDQMFTAVAKAPPAEGGWGWFPEYGYMYKPGPGRPTPKAP